MAGLGPGSPAIPAVLGYGQVHVPAGPGRNQVLLLQTMLGSQGSGPCRRVWASSSTRILVHWGSWVCWAAVS